MPKFVVAGREGPNQLPAHEVIVDGCHTGPYMRETESWLNLSAHAPMSPLEYPAPSDAGPRPHKRKGRSQRRLGRRNRRAPCIILSARQRELEQARATNGTFPIFVLFFRATQIDILSRSIPSTQNCGTGFLKHGKHGSPLSGACMSIDSDSASTSNLNINPKPQPISTLRNQNWAHVWERNASPEKNSVPSSGGRRVNRTPTDTLPQLFSLPHGHTLFAGSPECDCSHRGFSLNLRRSSEHRLAFAFLVWRCTQFRPLPPFCFSSPSLFFLFPNWSDMCSSRLRDVSVGYYLRKPLASTFAPVR
ncbi:hypothetical protein CKAH01_09754 [Colletotrichum kahawae]|uniref:Uncharacterized protein n=1 Tax=Colletotrichum kahawae TaxID=34407 RepID=A0AAD9XXJ4_COLKA|nr:hypothetical protein CKAH01_09754 [Colletotrichum kahawae]